MNRGVFRALSLLSMVGFGMITPILIAAYLGGKYLADNTLAMLGAILFGVAVAARNCYKLIMTEVRRGSADKIEMTGRPKGYRDCDEDVNK